MVKVGDIVSHQFRKTAVYLVTEAKNGAVSLRRVKKQSGYPIFGQTTYTERDLSKLTVVDSAVNHPFLGASGDVNLLDEETFRKFLSLASALELENLTCDGELSRSEVEARYKRLIAQWAELEEKVGFKVDSSDIWNRQMGARRA